jgi:hypothetical protein
VFGKGENDGHCRFDWIILTPAKSKLGSVDATMPSQLNRILAKRPPRSVFANPLRPIAKKKYGSNQQPWRR